jgi:hypothetical protein
MKYRPEVLANMGKWIDGQSVMLEQEIIQAKANEIDIEIDREILWGMLQGIGWKRYMLPRLIDNYHAIDISEWLRANCQGSYERNGRDFLFENERDFTMFVLRWT